MGLKTPTPWLLTLLFPLLANADEVLLDQLLIPTPDTPISAAQTKKTLDRLGEPFADFRQSHIAQELQTSVREFIQHKAYNKAIYAAEKARKIWLGIRDEHPDSPLIKKVDESVTALEVDIGTAYALQAKWTIALRWYDRAWLRSATANPFPPSAPGHPPLRYIEACSHRKTESCRHAAQRIYWSYLKGSDLAAQAEKIWPELKTAPPVRSTITRISQTYKTPCPEPDMALFNEGYTAYLAGKTGTARRTWEKLIETYPRSGQKSRTRFWLGRIQSESGNLEAAAELYKQVLLNSPLSYYGMLASIELKIPIETAMAVDVPTGVKRDPSLSQEELYHLERTETLVKQGLFDLSKKEAQKLRPREAFNSSFVLYLLQLNYQAHAFPQAFMSLGELVQRGDSRAYTTYASKFMFPTHYYPLLKSAAVPYNLDPLLLLSLAKQESAFDHEAKSSAGALGLTQVMPQTAIATEPGIDPETLIQVEVGAKVGAKYLAQMLKQFKGNVAFSLAAYNAGPGALQRWLREGIHRKGLLNYIEQIPYRETREYVGSILRNYWWYAQKIDGAHPTSLDAFFAGTP